MNELSTARAEPKADRKPRISKAVRHGLMLWLSGRCRTRKQAAEQANLSPEHFYRELAKPHVREWAERRFKHAIDELKLRSVGVLNDLLDNGRSEHVRAQIGLKALDSELAPDNGPLLNLNLNSPGYVIHLGDRTVTPEGTVFNDPPTIDVTPNAPIDRVRVAPFRDEGDE